MEPPHGKGFTLLHASEIREELARYGERVPSCTGATSVQVVTEVGTVQEGMLHWDQMHFGEHARDEVCALFARWARDARQKAIAGSDSTTVREDVVADPQGEKPSTKREQSDLSGTFRAEDTTDYVVDSQSGWVTYADSTTGWFDFTQQHCPKNFYDRQGGPARQTGGWIDPDTGWIFFADKEETGWLEETRTSSQQTPNTSALTNPKTWIDPDTGWIFFADKEETGWLDFTQRTTSLVS